ncbi:AAA family ATPase [Aquirufa ecclesiirivi]|uniref:AAA family ATPase n=1 Tax=Aquirufa ecclesiirivi TaxID=2715124 RepID=UPI0023D88771|nr:AAA family ATPase [Aquirufa ecclesiirivi]MDF0694867.1 AAA family ATPase [Aquirufa ecclesiirivi]
MKINNLNIEGVGGIKQLNLNFNDRMNLLCGPNGIGKTTILESIAHIFSNGDTNILKRNVASEISKISAEIDICGKVENKEIQFDTFIPETKIRFNGFHLRTSGLIVLKTTRTFQYQALQSVSKDSLKEDFILWNDAINGINLTDIKNWFVNRYLYSPHLGALTPEQINNFELAKKCFSLLNKDFSFSKVNASSNEIMINTPNGEIYYEYLSSGFKSIISILFGIIKEIEFRFKDPNINANDFQGIILIDEIELHLHPEWQEKIVDILLDVFPKVQFFVTTHSPHVIQTAKPKQIIALGLENNNIIQRELPNIEFGFQGWTIEEVLLDVMGMNSLRTQIFKTKIMEFEQAIEEENSQEANRIYSILENLLHPENTLRKLLKFQLAGL